MQICATDRYTDYSLYTYSTFFLLHNYWFIPTQITPNSTIHHHNAVNRHLFISPKQSACAAPVTGCVIGESDRLRSLDSGAGLAEVDAKAIGVSRVVRHQILQRLECHSPSDEETTWKRNWARE